MTIWSLLGKDDFGHGVHPPEEKERTAALPIRRMPFPKEVVIPLRQHAGKPAKLVVHEGQGDLSTQPDGSSGQPVGCGVIEAAGGDLLSRGPTQDRGV